MQKDVKLSSKNHSLSCSKSLSTLLRGITPDIMAVFIVWIAVIAPEQKQKKWRQQDIRI